MRNDLTKIFPTVEYGVVGTPTYPNGHIGYFICSKTVRDNVVKPKRIPDGTLELKYYR